MTVSVSCRANNTAIFNTLAKITTSCTPFYIRCTREVIKESTLLIDSRNRRAERSLDHHRSYVPEGHDSTKETKESGGRLMLLVRLRWARKQ